MIINIVREFFRDKAMDLAPKLRDLQRGLGDWQAIYQEIYEVSEDLIATLRRNHQIISIEDLVSPAELNQGNLGILSQSLDEIDSQDHHIAFPTAQKQQNSQAAIPRIGG